MDFFFDVELLFVELVVEVLDDSLRQGFHALFLELLRHRKVFVLDVRVVSDLILYHLNIDHILLALRHVLLLGLQTGGQQIILFLFFAI